MSCPRVCTTNFITPCFSCISLKFLYPLKHIRPIQVLLIRREELDEEFGRKRQKEEGIECSQNTNFWEINLLVSSLRFYPHHAEEDFNEPFIGSLSGAYILGTIFLLVSLFIKRQNQSTQCSDDSLRMGVI